MSELYERREVLPTFFGWYHGTADVVVVSFFLTRVSVWIPDGNRSHKVPFNRRDWDMDIGQKLYFYRY